MYMCQFDLDFQAHNYALESYRFHTGWWTDTVIHIMHSIKWIVSAESERLYSVLWSGLVDILLCQYTVIVTIKLSLFVSEIFVHLFTDNGTLGILSSKMHPALSAIEYCSCRPINVTEGRILSGFISRSNWPHSGMTPLSLIWSCDLVMGEFNMKPLNLRDHYHEPIYFMSITTLFIIREWHWWRVNIWRNLCWLVEY